MALVRQRPSGVWLFVSSESSRSRNVPKTYVDVPKTQLWCYLKSRILGLMQAQNLMRRMALGRLAAIVLFLGCVPFAPLNSQLRSHGTQAWFRGGYDSPSGGILELAVQYSLFIVEGRATVKEIIGDAVAGLDTGLLVGVATPAFKRPYPHLSLTAGIARTRFDDDCGVRPPCLDDPGAALAISFHASARLLPFLGLGFFAYWNRNGTEPWRGSGVMIELGKLR